MAVIEYDEYKQKLLALEPTLGELEKALGIPKAREELAELQKETEQDGFWNDLERSQQVSRQVKRLENKIKKHDKLVSEWEDTLTLCEMAQEGIKYVISWPNTDRGGNAHSRNIDGMPFWWVGPDGHSRVLFLQPGKYSNSGSMDKGNTTGRPWFGQRDPRKVPARIRMGSAKVDFTGKLVELERDHYPLDFIVLSWTLWDNSPVDADVPYAVNEWNKKYAYPKIVISGGHEIMERLEKDYGDRLPTVTCIGPGEYVLLRTEYFYFSLLPIDAVLRGVTIEGAKYPLRDAEARRGDSLTISNEWIEPTVRLRIREGLCWLICSGPSAR